MAEAHAAVAFTFAVTTEGLHIDFCKQAFRAVIKSGIRTGKKRIARLKNSLYNQVYPFHPSSWFYFAFAIFGATYMGYGWKISPVPYLEHLMETYVGIVSYYHVPACLLFSLFLWFTGSLMNQLFLRVLLSYSGWMYAKRGKKSAKIQLWATLVQWAQSSHPRLYGYQYSLPNLPLPRLKDTLERYLLSIKHLVSPEAYEQLVNESQAFQKSTGRKLQFFLWLKTLVTSNYVTDWWEDYVYLSSRDPLLANSNYYGIEWKLERDVKPTQSARAAMLVSLLLGVRQDLVREELPPIFIRSLVPMCSWQYERTFNTVRRPQLKKDKLVHWSDSKHIVVLHRGRYFRCPIWIGGEYLSAAELEYMFDYIIHHDHPSPVPGEDILASLTAGPRDAWATARETYFQTGVNRISLDSIEQASFFLCLEHEAGDIVEWDDPKDLTYLGKTFLTGNCCNRWFDKSFNLIVLPDGTFGFNAEHSWSDAPIMAHVIELCAVREKLGIEQYLPGKFYTADGRCDGPVERKMIPTRLRWQLPKPCIEVIENSLTVARQLADDTDLYVQRFLDFGKGVIVKCKISPDAVIQIALQIAYHKDQDSLPLVYEASMTRMFREGRTETVRSCSADSAAFVKAFLDGSCGVEQLEYLLRKAGDRHQTLIRDAVSGKGVDRHLFALYVMSRFLREDASFLKRIFSDPWKLSTSQTPSRQTGVDITLVNSDAHRCSGGGFGPVDKNGYGVSYMFSTDQAVCFHVSSCYSCEHTCSQRFMEHLFDALRRIRELLDPEIKSNGNHIDMNNTAY